MKLRAVRPKNERSKYMKKTFQWLPMGLALVVLLSANQCKEQTPPPDTKTGEHTEMTDTQETTEKQTNTSELIIEDIKVGTGAEAVAGKKVEVHYTGTLTNGEKFDSSKDRGEPFPFDLGAGQVIKGWDQGVAGMKEGGIRKLTIPPGLAYGARQVGPIPANSTLIFEVELLKVID